MSQWMEEEDRGCPQPADDGGNRMEKARRRRPGLCSGWPAEGEMNVKKQRQNNCHSSITITPKSGSSTPRCSHRSGRRPRSSSVARPCWNSATPRSSKGFNNLRDQGLVFRFGEVATAVERHDGGTVTTLASGKRIAADAVFYSAGRQGATSDIGLDVVGLEVDERGRIAVDENSARPFRTSSRSVT